MNTYISIKTNHLITKRLVILPLVISVSLLQAQYFTKITGVATEDNADSRSVNWIDYDNDDDLDLYISNGHNPPINAFLYENTGDGNFLKQTNAAVAKNNSSADGSSWADYNNDGNSDLYIVAWYGQRAYMYNNLGNGNFEQVTDGLLGKASGYSESCSWGDYDNDGYVDLYVANSGQNGKDANYFYHNDCGESFTRIMTGAPVTDKFSSRTVNWVDYDNDGDLDLFVCNESNEANNLYRNMLKESGIAEFEAVTNDPAVLSKSTSISSCWGDYDNDGDPDLFIANYGTGEHNELFRNNGNGSFTKITEGIQSNEGGNSFGCNWADFDNDGDLDLFVTNSGGGSQNNFLYKNLLMETDIPAFENVSDTVVTKDGGWSYGSSWGDYDKDGDLDLFVAKWHNDANVIHNALFRNEIGNLKNWITIKCVGKITNASAIGTKVLVQAVINEKPVWQMKEVSAQQSYCSENLFLHFGLGDATSIDSIILKWPSGINQYLTHANTNQFLTIVEDSLLYNGIKPTCEPFTPIKKIDNDLDTYLLEIKPNPTNGITTISYKIKNQGVVNIGIFDIMGKEVIKVIDENQQIGSYEVRLNLQELSECFYFIRLHSEGFTETKKIVMLKK
jgi:hypothetical protein